MVNREDVGDLVIELFRAATRVEGKGQLNLAKTLSAAAVSLAQHTAAERGLGDDVAEIAGDVAVLAERAAAAGLGDELCARIARGADVIGRGEQSYLDEFPDPYVCRRCGEWSGSVPESPCGGCGAHPLTFRRFEPVWWMTLYGPHEVVHRLAETPDLFGGAGEDLGPERMSWTPAGTAWSATDVFRHIRDANSVLAQRVDLILGAENPVLEFQPVFAWTNDRAEDGSAESILDTYRRSRAGVVERLSIISGSDWQRTGQHEEFGTVTLLDQASYFAAHETTHLRQLEALRRALSSEGLK